MYCVTHSHVTKKIPGTKEHLLGKILYFRDFNVPITGLEIERFYFYKMSLGQPLQNLYKYVLDICGIFCSSQHLFDKNHQISVFQPISITMDTTAIIHGSRLNQRGDHSYYK